MLTFNFSLKICIDAGLWKFQYGWKSNVLILHPDVPIVNLLIFSSTFTLTPCSVTINWTPSFSPWQCVMLISHQPRELKQCFRRKVLSWSQALHFAFSCSSCAVHPWCVCGDIWWSPAPECMQSAHIGDFTSPAGAGGHLAAAPGCRYPVFQASDPQQHPDPLYTHPLGLPAFWRVVALFPACLSKELYPSVQ